MYLRELIQESVQLSVFKGFTILPVALQVGVAVAELYWLSEVTLVERGFVVGRTLLAETLLTMTIIHLWTPNISTLISPFVINAIQRTPPRIVFIWNCVLWPPNTTYGIALLEAVSSTALLFDAGLSLGIKVGVERALALDHIYSAKCYGGTRDSFFVGVPFSNVASL